MTLHRTLQISNLLLSIIIPFPWRATACIYYLSLSLLTHYHTHNYSNAIYYAVVIYAPPPFPTPFIVLGPPPTLGKALVMVRAAAGVENRLSRMMFSSSTACSCRTFTALITVFPEPVEKWF